uniref:Uncharacterized protein n=1 Tax=Piliocolobus tephrosceles TaxID=591936 RepID=A0A8C9HC40_9PRIM
MAASAKKKNKKGKTISLTDFLTEDGGLVEEGAASKPVSWANETDDLEDVSTTCRLTQLLEKEVEELLQKEQEKLQRQLDEP